MTTIDLAEDWNDLTFEQQRDALKQTVTVPEVAELMGLEIDLRNKICSPWNPDDNTPSCHLYEDHFYDYSTGKFGDIFDLVMALNPETTLGQAVRAIKNRALKAGKEYGDVELSVPQELLDFTEQYYAAGGTSLEFFEGLNMVGTGVVRAPNLDILVPHCEPGRIYGVKVRGWAGGKFSWPGSQFGHRLYDPLGWPEQRTVVPTLAIICEGESDSWAMTHATVMTEVDVFALPSGAGTWRDHWLEDLEPYEQIYVCMDNDKSGQDAKDKLMRKIGYAKAIELKVPWAYNDARKAIKAGWDPSARLLGSGTVQDQSSRLVQ